MAPENAESATISASVVAPRLIMDKSGECNRLRKLCKGHMGLTYPPKCVANMFEHLRDELHTEASDIVGAGDGLFTGTPLVKNQIVGVYEGIEVNETEGEYVL